MASTGVKLIGECSTLSLSLSLSLARGSHAPTWTDPAFFYSSSHLLLHLRRHRDEQTSPGIYHGKQCHAADIPAVIARAWAAGVDRIIVRCFAAGHSPFRFFLAFFGVLNLLLSLVWSGRKVTGGSLKESREVLEIAETDGRLFCTVGVHPTRCGEFEESGDPEGHFQALLALAKEGIAKGKVFPGGVTHSFTGTAEDRDKLLSFEDTSENLDVLQGIPAERMMIETDSPYCDIKNTHAGIKFVKSVWPSKKKEKYEPDSTVKGRNEPCLVRQVLEVVAGCKGISDIEGLSKTLYHNTCRFFFPQDLDASADAQLESGAAIQNS
uniref:Uncharacterized protein n=1 Tax=Oryza nivara TaxID=4536 RepID=A0A0E0I7M1_ORYNI